MKNMLKFFKKAGELKGVSRKGMEYYGVKEVDSATDHTFRLAMMVWVFGQGRRLNMARAFKLALIHDLCKVYSGDITPYDGLFSKKKGENPYALAWRWRRLSLEQKQKHYEQRFQKEEKALEKLMKDLPDKVRQDMKAAWVEYKRMETREAQFVHQLDRSENLLEAFEAWEKNNDFPTRPWWEHADEVVDDKELLLLLEEISNEEIRGLRKRSQKKKSGSKNRKKNA